MEEWSDSFDVSQPIFRPFTREELEIIETRIFEKKLLEKKRAEKKAKNIAVRTKLMLVKSSVGK